MTLLNDGIEQASIFFEEPVIQEDAKIQLEIDGAIQSIQNIIYQLEESPWDGKQIERANEIINFVCRKTSIKKGIIMKSLRAGLLGQMKGPDLISSWRLLAKTGKDLKRLRRCVQLN